MLTQQFFRAVLLLLAWCGLIAHGYAATREVGRDKPYSTIQSAISAADQDDVIMVYSGNYDEALLIDRLITIQEAPGNIATLYLQRSAKTPAGNAHGIDVTGFQVNWIGIDIVIKRNSYDRIISVTGLSSLSFIETDFKDQPSAAAGVGENTFIYVGNNSSVTAFGSNMDLHYSDYAVGFDVRGSGQVNISNATLALKARPGYASEMFRIDSTENSDRGSQVNLSSVNLRQIESHAPDHPTSDTLFRIKNRGLVRVGYSHIETSENTRSVAVIDPAGYDAGYRFTFENCIMDLNKSIELEYAFNLLSAQGSGLSMINCGMIWRGNHAASRTALIRGGSSVNIQHSTFYATYSASQTTVLLNDMPGDTWTIQNNIFYLPDSERGVVSRTSGTLATLTGGVNLRYTGAGIPAVEILPGSILTADPLLAADHVHLLPGSPAINTGGTTVNTINDDIDGFGTSRNSDIAPDLGADEFGSTLEQPDIEIFEPYLGRVLDSGGLIEIHWRTNLDTAGTGVHFDIYNAQGFVVSLGDAWNAAGAASSFFQLPLLPDSNDYYIQAVSTWDPSFTGRSNSYFKISGGVIQAINLPQEISWPRGSLQEIQWRSNPAFAGTELALELYHQGHYVLTLATVSNAGSEGTILFETPVVYYEDDYRFVLISQSNWDYKFISPELTIGNPDDPAPKAAVNASWVLY